MPTYAVKIGEIQLQAGRPITQEDRKRAKEHIESGRVRVIWLEAGDGTDLFIDLAVDSH